MSEEWVSFNELSAAQQYAVVQAYLVRTHYMSERDVRLAYKSGSQFHGDADYLFYMGADRKRMFEEGKVIPLKSTKGGDAGFLNRLHWKKGSHDVLKLTPAQLSELVPEVRLYKVVYDKHTAEKEQIEFKFPSLTDPDMLSSTSDTGFGLKAFQYKYIGSNPATVRNDIEAKLVLYFQNFGELLRERTNGPGGTPYKFLELFSRATKIQDGTDSMDSPPEDAPPLNLLNTEEAAEYSLNAVARSDCDNGIVSPRIYKGPTAFEIKVEVGYGVPPNSTLYTQEQWLIVKEALENAKQSFFLTLIDHDFAFGQDGTFTLDLNYRARLAGVLDTPDADILRLDLGESDAISSEISTLSWLDEAGLFNVFDPEGYSSTGSISKIMERLNWDLKNAKACCDVEKRDFIQRRMDRLEDAIRSSKYQVISNKLMKNKLLKNSQVEQKILKFWANNGAAYKANRDEMLSTVDTPIEAVEEGGAIAEDNLAPVTSRTDPNTNEQGDLSFGETLWGWWEWDDDKADASIEAVMNSIPDTRLEAWEQLTLPENQVVVGTDVHSGHTTKGMYLNVPFFALGDLLDIVMRMATRSGDYLTEDEGDRICLAIGTIEIENQMYSLADCPISWYSFRNFWYEKVVKPRRTKYPALQFLRDILRDLVFGAINSPYWTANGKQVPEKFRLNQAFVDLAEIPMGKEYGTKSKNPLRWEALSQGRNNSTRAGVGRAAGWVALDLDVLHPDSEMFQLAAQGGTTDIFQYIIVCVKGGGTEQFQRKNIYDSAGNLVDPEITSRHEYNEKKLNIANFGFGEDRGMFIEANFSKTDLPFRRESRYLESGNSMYAQLSNVYDVEVKMFGNPFFFPGMYIYVNPFGLNKNLDPDLSIGRPDGAGVSLNDEGKPVQDYEKSSISNLMGLGGYFIVTEVTGEVNDSQYIVTVKATHDNTGSNFDTGKDHPGVDDKCPEQDE